MPGFDPTAYIRYSIDWGLAGVNLVGLLPYRVDLITIQGDQVSFQDTGANRSVNIQRLLVADGYRSFAPGDGYLNPHVAQENGEQLAVANGQFTSNLICLHTVVFPYNVNNFAGGTDPIKFQPSSGQVYVRITGPGLAPQGNFFDVKEVRIGKMANLTYDVILTATLQEPRLS